MNPVSEDPGTVHWRHLVTMCSVLYRLRGILPPARCARIFTLGLERFQGQGHHRSLTTFMNSLIWS